VNKLMNLCSYTWVFQFSSVCSLQSLLCALHCVKTPEFESQQLSSIAVYRRVYVNRDENVQVARYIVVSLLMRRSSCRCKSCSTYWWQLLVSDNIC
jgi:hypothetical protein